MTAGDGGLAVGEVARRMGVAVTTLRSWHRRYGLGPSRHLAQHHRRYTDADVARLEIMRRLTGQGVPAAEAARVATSHRPDEPVGTVRGGGGHAIPVGRAGPAARGLGRAAMRLDAAAMVELIAAAVAAHGVVPTWDRLLCPVLVGVGERHAASGALVDVEHLLSRSISQVFAAMPRPSGASPRILLASAADEQHCLPLEALAAALAEQGHPSRMLGARVPAQALADAVRRTGPAVVVVWSHATETGDPGQLRGLVASRPRPAMVVAAGPGWQAAALPTAVERPAHLVEALALCLAIVGGPARV